MHAITLIFPHHLAKESKAISKDRLICFVEDPLFFHDKKYPAAFHKQKLIFHRASMKCFEKKLQSKGYKTAYIDAGDLVDYTKGYGHLFKHYKVKQVHCLEMDDFILEKRMTELSARHDIELTIHPSPLFLSSHDNFTELFEGKSHLFFHTFYISQRRRLGLLLDKRGMALGGKWSFDSENRKKVPKGLALPHTPLYKHPPEVDEATEYVEKHFKKHLGITDNFNYVVTHEDAKKVLRHFLEEKLLSFGDYEDAIMQEERVLFHSQLSPLLNIGLITPQYVIEQTLSFAEENHVPLNSLEGFIRQVIGWREYIRSVYLSHGSMQRSKNFFHHKRKMPACFYDGTSGILPIDHSIKALHEGAYLHHIERLMVLGNFFLLCEVDPNDIYRWFMEFFIDAYDWVMVPNVYGMSQYADGGLMTTKPYISGSNYILKMSNYPKGPWCEIWDSLFWRFMIKHDTFFKAQPRLHMLTAMAMKKKDDKELLKKGDHFLKEIQ